MKTPCHLNLLLFYIFILVLSFSTSSPIPGKAGKAARNETVLEEIVKINENVSKEIELFEGDIVPPPSNIPGANTVKRDVLRAREYLWIHKEVPYVIASHFNDYERKIIRDTLEEFHKKTCLVFKEREKQVNYVRFFKGVGCYSSVGRLYWKSGSQDISLGEGCVSKGTIIHEVMHTLGFWHEQSRPDRNKFVEIFWENIMPGRDYNFIKKTYQVADTLGIDYDYDSIMHYGKYTFSKNNKPTLQAVGDPKRDIGQRYTFSAKDIIQINSLYGCKSNSSGFMSPWSGYDPCDDTCFKERQRFCSHTNMSECPNVNRYGVEIEKKKCSHSECYAAVDGHWGKWSVWNLCSTECGHGIQNRTRVCNDPKPKHGGKDCAQSTIHERKCIIKQCGLGNLDCEFDGQNWCFWKNNGSNRDYSWSRKSGPTPSGGTGPSEDHTDLSNGHYVYAEASSPARPGFKARLMGMYFDPTPGRYVRFWYHMYGTDIGGLRVFVKDKTTGKEKMIWELTGNQGNSWKFANATISSDNKYQVVFEAERGSSWRGDIALDDVSFKKKNMPVNGGYSEWTIYGPCSKSCGNGVKIRKRFCTNPSPANGGRNCSGPHKESKNCILPSCPVNGGYTQWSDYGSCSKSCGDGVQMQKRFCTNPSPAHGGRNCSGPHKQFKNCILSLCPVHGGYTQWSTYSSCSRSCGNGVKIRKRLCTDPRPAHGGKNCSGPHKESKNCILPSCPVNGGYTQWSIYGSCSTSCGDGVQLRKRHCTNPSPAHGGRNCSGLHKQYQNCILSLCPINGGYTQWSTYSSCSRSCGDGVQIRKRLCTDPSPAHGGRNCSGSHTQSKNCILPSCPDALEQMCNIKITPEGCYADTPGHLVFPKILDTHRSANRAEGYHNVMLSWSHYTRSLNELLCDCAKRTKTRSFKYFGLQFYGECWSSSNITVNFGEFGTSNRCIDGHYKSCVKPAEKACIGRDLANFVYSIV